MECFVHLPRYLSYPAAAYLHDKTKPIFITYTIKFNRRQKNQLIDPITNGVWVYRESQLLNIQARNLT